MTNDVSPRVVLLGEYNIFSHEIYKILKNYKLKINIISHDNSLWKKALGDYLELQQTFTEKRRLDDGENINYVICIFDFSFLNEFDELAYKRDLGKLEYLMEVVDCKKIFVFSYNQKEILFKKSVEIIDKIFSGNKDLAGIVFIGDLFENDWKEKYFFESELIDAIEKEYFNVSKSFQFFPIASSDAAELLIKSLFSLKAYGAKTAIIGKPVTTLSINKYLSLFSPGTRDFKSTFTQHLPYVKDKVYSFQKPKKVILNALNEVFEKVSDNKKEISKAFVLGNILDRHKTKSAETKSGLLGKRRIPNKRSLMATSYFFLTIYFLLPLLVYLLSLANLLLGLKIIRYGYTGVFNSQLRLSSLLTGSGGKYFDFLSRTPLIGKYYIHLAESEKILNSYSQIAGKFLVVIKNIENLSEDLSRPGNVAPDNYRSNISLDLREIYMEMGFLEGEVENSGELAKKTLGLIIKEEEFKELRAKTFTLSKIFSRLDELLGKDKPRTYLILFQDDSNIRATGGIIKSFALVRFSDGSIIEKNVFDTNEADVKLEGKVEPPLAMSEYYGLKNWYLRDSNWDPDFSVSASQAEWFIDKEMDVTVDGVISVNTKIFGEIIEKVGVEKFKNINFTFLENEANNYMKNNQAYPDKTENSEQKEFIKYLFDADLKLSSRQKRLIFKTILNALERKDIQVFIKDNMVRNHLQDIGWDGTLAKSDCQGNCYSDIVVPIESAVEGNSQNITRYAELKVFMEENLIKRKLTLFLENKNKGTYKAYLRIITNSDSGFAPAIVIDSKEKQSVELDIKGQRGFEEAGVYIEIPENEVKAVVFDWESGSNHSYEDEGKYSIYWWKQSGLDEFLIKIDIKFPDGVDVKSENQGSLTGGNAFSYNTALSQGVSLSLFWDKK